jgi:hypothetical protein
MYDREYPYRQEARRVNTSHPELEPDCWPSEVQPELRLERLPRLFSYTHDLIGDTHRALQKWSQRNPNPFSSR